VIFFSRYKAYVEVESFSTTEDDQRTWNGHVESKVRFLISQLEQINFLKYAHPYTKSFDQTRVVETKVKKEKKAAVLPVKEEEKTEIPKTETTDAMLVDEKKTRNCQNGTKGRCKRRINDKRRKKKLKNQIQNQK